MLRQPILALVTRVFGREPAEVVWPALLPALNDAMGRLNEQQRSVLQLRFGLYDGQPRTQKAVGLLVGVGRGRISQIEAKALRKLRHPESSRGLRLALVWAAEE